MRNLRLALAIATASIIASTALVAYTEYVYNLGAATGWRAAQTARWDFENNRAVPNSWRAWKQDHQI